jgi:hypothetical protein
MKSPKRSRPVAVPTIFVAIPSAQADQTEAALQARGLSITRADNICVAEMYAEAQHFEAAIYDQSLSQEEQVSLARVMRIRWPWMRILRLVPSGAPLVDDALFDLSALSASQLASWVERSLAG